MGQASVLTIYDHLRIREPQLDGSPTGWDALDERMRAALTNAATQGRKIRLLTGTLNGPTERTLIRTLTEQFPTFRHVEADALSCSAIPQAHAQTHGISVLPHYRFDKAQTIVSFGADFLGTWISPVEFAAAYSAGRSASGNAGHGSPITPRSKAASRSRVPTPMNA